VVISISLLLPMSLDEFDEEAQNLLVGAIAQVMDVNSLQVSIAGITAKELRRSGAAHRLLLAQGVQVDIEITTEPPAAAPSIDAINAQLALVGLPQATLNDSASGVIITGEYRVVIQYLPFCPRNFQLRIPRLVRQTLQAKGAQRQSIDNYDFILTCDVHVQSAPKTHTSKSMLAPRASLAPRAHQRMT
jgi:hypothetical protein